MRRSYEGAAQAAQLTQDLGGSTGDLTIYCDNLTNWPTGTGSRPFFVVIDRGKANEEKILCSSRSSNVLTVFDDGLTNGRAADDTAITSHTTNSVIEHVFTATDADESNFHVNAPTQHITLCTSTTRPAAPVANQVIFESDTATMLAYIGVQWVPISGSGATGGGTDRVFWNNGQNVTASYVIPTGFNSGTFGPVTINSGVTVTVPSGSSWVVV